MKTTLRLIVIAIIALGALFACFKFGLFGFDLDFLKRKPLSIEKTANVVEEVKKIGEFTSACYYEEMALHDSYADTSQILGRNADALAKKTSNKLGFGNKISNLMGKATASVTTSTNEIVLIGKGQVRAGFDLAKVQEGDIQVHDDTLAMELPQAEIFDIIMNPSDFSTEYEKGTWSHELTKPIKERARTDLEQNAIKSGILEKAERAGIDRLTNLFKTFGFNTVILTVAKVNNEE